MVERVKRQEIVKIDGRVNNGAVSKYNPKLFPKMVRLLASRGAILTEIADALSVTKQTIIVWMHTYPEFMDAVHSGNDAFNPRVERALAERAIGFYAEVEEWKSDKDGLRKVTYRKYFPPDVTACIFFLKNRMPHKYRDVQKHHHSGEVFQTSAELLVELRKGVLQLKAEGIDILEGVESVALPAPPKGNGKGNGRKRIVSG